jgi:hypothetical protein
MALRDDFRQRACYDGSFRDEMMTGRTVRLYKHDEAPHRYRARINADIFPLLMSLGQPTPLLPSAYKDDTMRLMGRYTRAQLSSRLFSALMTLGYLICISPHSYVDTGYYTPTAHTTMSISRRPHTPPSAFCRQYKMPPASI